MLIEAPANKIPILVVHSLFSLVIIVICWRLTLTERFPMPSIDGIIGSSASGLSAAITTATTITTRIPDSPSYRITLTLCSSLLSSSSFQAEEEAFDKFNERIKDELEMYSHFFDIKIDSRILFISEDLPIISAKDCLSFFEEQNSLFPNLDGETNVNFIIRNNCKQAQERTLLTSEGKGGFLKSPSSELAIEDYQLIMMRLHSLLIGDDDGISDGCLEKFEDQLLSNRISRSKEILLSLKRLLEAFPEIRVVKEVYLLISGVISAIKESEDRSNDKHTRLRAASRAVQLAEQVFFDPSMMANQYFPIEHMLGVYLPIFFPFMLPLVVQFILLLKRKNK